jgi:hypothetical protein
VAARTWYCNRETEEGVRLMLASKKNSNDVAAHRRMKKVARGGALAVRTRAQPRHGEEARRCSGFGGGGIVGGGSGVERGGIKGGIEGGSPAYEEGGTEVG